MQRLRPGKFGLCRRPPVTQGAVKLPLVILPEPSLVWYVRLPQRLKDPHILASHPAVFHLSSPHTRSPRGYRAQCRVCWNAESSLMRRLIEIMPAIPPNSKPYAARNRPRCQA